MVILPIKDLREEDGPTIGSNLMNLGKLSQAGFPIPAGIIITPPEINLKSVLEHFNLKTGEIFDQHLTIIRQEVAKIAAPEELVEDFKKRHLDGQKLWQHLLEFWLNEIRSKIWREGFSPDLTRNLPAQPVFFMDKISASGKAFFDYERNFLVVQTEFGSLEQNQNEELTKLVKEANKRLMLPQIYDWSVEKNLKIVKVTPFTQYLAEEIISPKQSPIQNPKIQKSTVKVLLNLSTGKATQDLDGVVLASENLVDFDAKLLKLIEACQVLTSQPVILKLFDKKDRFGKIRGTQYLIHEKNILKKDVEAVQFLRHQKYLQNINLAIPFVRSAQELKELKQELLALKLSRSSLMKFWLEMAVPENLLNLEKYLEVGIDGVILNCNEMASWVGGFDPDEPDSVYYKGEVEAFIKVVEQSLGQFHKAKIPVLASGSLALHDDVLSMLVSKGVWGILVDQANVINIHDRIRLIERRLLNKKS